MAALQITAIILGFGVSLVAWLLLFRQVYRFTKVFRAGAPDPSRTDQPGKRTATLAREVIGHTRMARLPLVAIAHWVTMVGFGLLFFTLVNAFLQLIQPDAVLPIIGHFPPYEWLTEAFAWAGLVGILVLITIRQRAHPRSSPGAQGRRSRFFGSTWWQAYYVEFTILGVLICVLLLRGLEYALALQRGDDHASLLHFPLTAWLAGPWAALSTGAIEQTIIVLALIKILISFAWMITIAVQPTMGVAWHRFLAFFNIWFKRHADGRTSLGAPQPMRHQGQPITAESLEELMEDEDASLTMGAGRAEDFTWKGLLDFTTCTECGRCQSQCPAWNTDKPLSPKLLVMALSDHAHAKAPWLLATEQEREKLPEHTRELAEVALVGSTSYDIERPLSAYTATGPDAVIDADVLWSCTTCGACVEQCPVDIEHVDAIVDMRRHQVLIESAFPTEFGSLFKNMENKGNPWGMAPKMRLDWAKGLDFEVPVIGADVEDASQVDYLFWVGCAGALEDRAKKTTRAVAELLHLADVSFAVLGEGESCTGDSARRAGNEVLFQMLAAGNVEMLNEAGATKIVVTCAHCFNTIRNEYSQIGGSYEVLHHTQLLNRLVRDKRLTPVARPADRPQASSAKDAASSAATVTYHDPCYLGRHNQVYAPPRDLLGTLPGVTLTEMPRSGEKSFCCGAGGARMWAEEKLGTRVNLNRTSEAVATGADRIAIGCPFCRIMLSDGLTAQQSEGTAREEVEVVDIAQMLLAAVRTESSVETPAPTVDVDEQERSAAATTSVASPASAGSASSATTEAQDTEAQPASTPQPARRKPMSASDALAAVGGAPGAARRAAPAADPAADEASPTVADEPASQTQTPPERQPPAAQPTGTMSATEALAMMRGSSAPPTETTPETPTETPAPAADAAPRAMPTGTMSATEALAMMRGSSAPPTETSPETPTEAPAPETMAEEPAPAPPRTPAPAAPAADEAPRAMPTGTMSATEALAMMRGAAKDPAPTAQPEAPQPKAPSESPPAPEAAAQPEPQAATEAPTSPADTETSPVPPAPHEQKAPGVLALSRPNAAAFARLQERAGGTPIAASEALRILAEQD